MSTLKVDAIRHNSATSDAITTASDGTCTARITGMTGGGGLSHRNKVINGSMIINQRASSYTATNEYTLDRFHHATGSAFTFDTTTTQDSSSPDGFTKSLKITPDSTQTPTGSHNGVIRQIMEGQDLQDLAFGTSSAKSVTVSFYAKSASSNNNHQYGLQLRTRDSSNQARYVSQAFTVTTSWQRYTMTFAGNTSVAIRNDNDNGFEICFHLASGPDDITSAKSTWTTSGAFQTVTGQSNFMDNTSNEFYLTGVQLEVGDTATTFEHRSFTEELTRCYRYYRRFGANGALPTPAPYNRFSIGYSPSSSEVRYPFQLDPPMRIKPVNSNFSKSGNFSIQPGSIGSYTLTCDDNSCSANMMIAIMGNTSVSSGTGSAVSLHANNDTTAYIEISAEF